MRPEEDFFSLKAKSATSVSWSRLVPAIFCLAICFVLFGCGKSKEQAKQELSSLNLQFNGDDFVKSAGEADLKALALYFEAGIDPNVVALSGSTALMAASEKGRTEVVKQLIAHGASPNTQGKDGLTSLMLAAQNNHPDIVKMLIDARADVSVQDHSGWSAMMKAVYQGNTACAQLLADKSKEDLDRALLVATLTGHNDTVKMLLDNGAEVDSKADDGRTALMFAASKGNKDLVTILLKAGADPSIADHSGQTAEAVAAAKGFADVAALIRQAPPPSGAKKELAAVPPSPAKTAPVTDQDFLNQSAAAANSGTSPAPSSPADNTAANPSSPAGNTNGRYESLSRKVAVSEIQEDFLPVKLTEIQGKTAKIESNTGETYSVKSGEQLHGLDYRVVDVQSRNIDDKDGNLVDASFVKLKRIGTDDTISLIKGMPAREKGSYVTLDCSGQSQKVGLDKEFKIPDEPGHTYKVIDIRPTQVIIRRLDDGQVWTLNKK